MLKRFALGLTGLLMATVAAISAQQAGALNALDFYQIHELNARYNHALDNGDGAAFAALFTADGVLVDENGRTSKGTAALAALANGTAGKGPTNVKHFYINLAVDPAPGGARAHSHAMVVVPQGGQPDRVRNSGQYWDEYVKGADGWRIRARTFHKQSEPWPGTMPLATTVPTFTAASSPQTANGLTAQDYADIYQLYGRAAVGYDKVVNEGRMWAETFTADGVYTDAAGRSTTGRDALLQAVWMKGVKPVTTFVTNIRIDSTAGGAVNARAYLMSRTIPPLPQAAFEEPGGIFFDQLVKTPEGWRFRNRQLVAPNAQVPPAVAKVFMSR